MEGSMMAGGADGEIAFERLTIMRGLLDALEAERAWLVTFLGGAAIERGLPSNHSRGADGPSTPNQPRTDGLLARPTLDEVNTVAEVAAFTKYTQREIQRAIQRGELDVLRPGKSGGGRRGARIAATAVWAWLLRESA
jgi:hypothetical protein